MESHRAALRLVLASLQWDNDMLLAAAEGHDPGVLLLELVGYAQMLALELFGSRDEAVRWIQRELLGALDGGSSSTSS